MTQEEFDNLQWTCTSHLSMSTEHVTNYIAETPFSFIAYHRSVPYKNGKVDKKKKPRSWYGWNGKCFDTKEQLLDAINSINK